MSLPLLLELSSISPTGDTRSTKIHSDKFSILQQFKQSYQAGTCISQRIDVAGSSLNPWYFQWQNRYRNYICETRTYGILKLCSRTLSSQKKKKQKIKTEKTHLYLVLFWVDSCLHVLSYFEKSCVTNPPVLSWTRFPFPGRRVFSSCVWNGMSSWAVLWACVVGLSLYYSPRLCNGKTQIHWVCSPLRLFYTERIFSLIFVVTQCEH